MPIDIIIADDHEFLRRGLRQALEVEFADVEVREADGLDGALDHLAERTADLLVLDLTMPGMLGDASIRAIRETYPSVKIAVLSGSDLRQDIIGAMDGGAHGYIIKSAPPDESLDALRRILAGQIYVPPALADIGGAEPMTPRARPAAAAPETRREPAPERPCGPNVIDLTQFTARQQDVLKLLAQGLSNKEIARALGLGEGTIKIHLAAIYRALRARNRTEAAALAARLQF